MTIPTAPPTTREIDFESEVRRLEGPDYTQPIKAYKFSNGREFYAPGSRGEDGIYNGSAS